MDRFWHFYFFSMIESIQLEIILKSFTVQYVALIF